MNIWLYTPLLPSERDCDRRGEPAEGERAVPALQPSRWPARDRPQQRGSHRRAPLKADADPTIEVGVLFTALRDYLGKLRIHAQRVRQRFAASRPLPAPA